MIDNDSDPQYDKVTKVKYYNMNDKTYGFKVDDTGLAVSTMQDGEEVNIGRAMKSSYNDDYYVISTKEMNGVGYYTETGNFIMEYYDEESGEMKVIEFQNMKF